MWLKPKQIAQLPAWTLGIFGLGLIYFAWSAPFDSIVRTVVWQCAWIAITVRGLWKVQPWAWWSAMLISVCGSYYALVEVAPGLLRNLLNEPGNAWSLQYQWPSFLQLVLIVSTVVLLLLKTCRKKFWK